MIEDVRQLGIYSKEKQNLDIVSILTEDIALRNIDKVVYLIFKITNEAVFEKVVLEDFDISKSTKLLYRSGTSRGTNITPAAKITGDILKTYELKIKSWFKNNQDNGIITQKIWNYLSSLSKESLNDFNNELLSVMKNLDPKKQHLVTVKILENSQEKYIGEIEEFKSILIESSQKRFSFQSSKGESKGTGYCALCEKQDMMLGYGSPFAFYSLDQRGFAYDLDQTNSWKQLPICLECALDLDLGKQYVSEKLDFPFYGFRFYFIPKFVFSDIQNEILRDIDDFSKEKINLYQNGPLSEEENWQEILQKKEDSLLLVFLFYEKQMSRLIIKKYIEDVLPSWLRVVLVNFKDELATKSLYYEETMKKIFGQKAVGDFREYLNSKKNYLTLWSIIKNFFPTSKIDGIYDKYFLDIVGDILKGGKINEKLLIQSYITKLRSIFRNESGNWNLNVVTLQSFLLHSVLLNIGTINGGKPMLNDKILENMKLTKEEAKNIKAFLEEHTNALNTPEKKAIFLQGVLTRFLLAVQYANLKSNPFREKLYGLQLDKRKIKKLFPQTIEKLREYKISYSWLEELISKFLLLCDDQGWSLTNNEISYYFVLGLTLGLTFKTK